MGNQGHRVSGRAKKKTHTTALRCERKNRPASRTRAKNFGYHQAEKREGGVGTDVRKKKDRGSDLSRPVTTAPMSIKSTGVVSMFQYKKRRRSSVGGKGRLNRKKKYTKSARKGTLSVQRQRWKQGTRGRSRDVITLWWMG